MTFNWAAIFAEGAGIADTVLVDMLRAGGEKLGNPEAAEAAIALLRAKVEAGSLADVAKMIPVELKNIFALKFDPRDHPSDRIG